MGYTISSSVSDPNLIRSCSNLSSSAVRLTDENGAIVQSLAYDPFGATVYSVGTNEPSRQFNGQIKDATGLYYYGARYYDPDLGRFISPDTVLDGLNRYAYCGNNPVRFTDPSGHFFGEVALFACALFGAYLGGVASNDWEWNPAKWNWQSWKTWLGMGLGALTFVTIGNYNGGLKGNLTDNNDTSTKNTDYSSSGGMGLWAMTQYLQEMEKGTEAYLDVGEYPDPMWEAIRFISGGKAYLFGVSADGDQNWDWVNDNNMYYLHTFNPFDKIVIKHFINKYQLGDLCINFCKAFYGPRILSVMSHMWSEGINTNMGLVTQKKYELAYFKAKDVGTLEEAGVYFNEIYLRGCEAGKIVEGGLNIAQEFCRIGSFVQASTTLSNAGNNIWGMSNPDYPGCWFNFVNGQWAGRVPPCKYWWEK